MDILEAKKMYDSGKRIRHNSWIEGSYCSQDRTNVGMGLSDNFSGFVMGFWLGKYAEGWEIYIRQMVVEDMNPGQKFSDLEGVVYQKLIKYYNGNGNCFNIRTFKIHFLMGSYTLIDEAG